MPTQNACFWHPELNGTKTKLLQRMWITPTLEPHKITADQDGKLSLEVTSRVPPGCTVGGLQREFSTKFGAKIQSVGAAFDLAANGAEPFNGVKPSGSLDTKIKNAWKAGF